MVRFLIIYEKLFIPLDGAYLPHLIHLRGRWLMEFWFWEFPKRKQSKKNITSNISIPNALKNSRGPKPPLKGDIYVNRYTLKNNRAIEKIICHSFCKSLYVSTVYSEKWLFWLWLFFSTHKSVGLILVF